MTSDIVSVEIGRSTWQGPAEEAPRRAGPITMTYRNYRGEIAERRIIPEWIGFGATDWHPEPQWLLRAFDLDKNARRDFALADCQFADLYRSAEMAECAAFSAGYEAGERDGRASGQQVRALEQAFEEGLEAATKLVAVDYICDAIRNVENPYAALTPAPQPEGEAPPAGLVDVGKVVQLCEDAARERRAQAAGVGDADQKRRWIAGAIQAEILSEKIRSLPVTPLYAHPPERGGDVQEVRLATREDVLAGEILTELTRARAKFPGKNVTFAALVEEVGELATAVFEEGADRVRKEAVQVAVMAMRMILDGDHCFEPWRAEKGLDPLDPELRAQSGGDHG